MATTTISAIRAQLKTTIEGLTPVRRPDFPFQRGNTRYPIEEWASKNSGKMRHFEIKQEGGAEIITVGNFQITRREPFQIVVMYPMLIRLAGDDEIDDWRDMLREDMRTIMDAVFSPQSYLSGVCLQTLADYEVNEGDDIWYLTLNFEVQFNEAATVSI